MFWGGGAEGQHPREELMAPVLLSLTQALAQPGGAAGHPAREGGEGKAACGAPGDTHGPAPWVPLLPGASHLQGAVRIYGFSVVAPLLTAAEPGFGLRLGGNGSSLGAGLTPPVCGLRAAAWERANQRKTTFFPLILPQSQPREHEAFHAASSSPFRLLPGSWGWGTPLLLLPTPRRRARCPWG